MVTDPLRLLLIEDNPGDARLIRELLREATELSRRVHDQVSPADRTANSGSSMPELFHETELASGLSVLGDEEVDVVLVDLGLPDSEGLETLTAVLDRTDAPVVVLTGLRNRDLGVEALHHGAEEFLVKDELTSDLLLRSVYQAIERREYKRELRRYETLVEQSTDVNSILDLDGTIQYVTSSVTSVLGYDPDELVGKNAFDYVHPDDRESTREQFESAIESEDATTEFRFEHADGSWVVLEARGRNLLDDPLIDGIVAYSRDVTERKRRERKLEQFASVVSHDLRNPLGIAQIYLNEAREGGDAADFAEAEDALDRMDTIIRDLLTMAREGQTVSTTESVSLSAVVERAWKTVETPDVTLRTEDDLGSIEADETQLQRVFENLFRNSVEHGSTNSRAEPDDSVEHGSTGSQNGTRSDDSVEHGSTSSRPPADDAAERGTEVEVRVGSLDDGFYVEDSGPGIEPGDRATVFDYGYSTDGTGFGLALVREIVNAHGWEIAATAGRDGGARFEIRGVDGWKSSDVR